VSIASAPGWFRYIVMAVLGYGLVLLPWYFLEQGTVPLVHALVTLPLCAALGLCLGYLAFAGLRRPSIARRDSEQDSSIQHVLAQHALILENAIEGIALLSVDGTVVQINPAFGDLAGIPHDMLVGKHWLDLAPLSERAALHEAFRVAHGKGRAVVECVLRHGEASLPVELTLVRDAAVPGKTACLHLLARDLRERRATARFEYLALHDPLTGLPNRRALMDRLEDSLDSSPGRPAKVAVLLFDIDRFKDINDAFGHAAGDAVLKHTVSQMSRAVRPTDTLARLGGDEFVLIARGVDSLEQAEALAERFRSEAARPLRIGRTDISVRLSTGVALAGGSMNTADAILEAADRAMYADKGRSPEPGPTGTYVRETIPLVVVRTRMKA
jgi:diguanylate cyclase (GGDEF)-like protein/PAS domain S-box-containing protein